MADLTPKTIIELPAAASLGSADLFAVSSSGISKKATWATITGEATFSAKSDLFSSYSGVDTATGVKRFGYVDAYIKLPTGGSLPASGGTIATVKEAYRPLHTVCFSLFAYASPYKPVGSLWIDTAGAVTIYYDATPQYAYVMYAVAL